MKRILRIDLPAIVLVILNFAPGLIFNERLPERVASHWSLSGSVDGYSDKLFIVLWFPLGILLLYLLMTLLPMIDPRHKNVRGFELAYSAIKNALVLFLSAINAILLMVALGVDINISVVVPSLIGALLIVMGIFMPSFKQNFFIGIRTPWTIESITVWEATHRLGGVVFIIGGALAVLFSLLRWHYVLLALLLLTAVIPIVYSYVIYSRLNKK